MVVYLTIKQVDNGYILVHYHPSTDVSVSLVYDTSEKLIAKITQLLEANKNVSS